MTKLLLTLILMFTFGTSLVSAEENTINIDDRISELTERKPNSELAIKAKVDELSEAELKAIIENVDELTEQTEDDLAIKEAATIKLKEMKSFEKRSSIVGIVGLFWLMFSLSFTLYICFWDAIDYAS